jgi:hypothetical protein
MSEKICYGSWAEVDRFILGEPVFDGDYLSRINEEIKKRDPGLKKAAELAEKYGAVRPKKP